jgi:hypothetical protein
MANNKAFEVWSGLPTWAKGTIAVGGLAVIYFAGRGIWKRIIQNINKQKDLKVQYDAKAEERQLAQQGIKRTLSDSQLQAMCQKIVEAFDGCGTTEESVYQVMKQMKNKADVLALISTYGIRKYDQCNWNEGFGDNEYTLPRAIESELDSSELSELNKILSSKRIDFKF